MTERILAGSCRVEQKKLFIHWDLENEALVLFEALDFSPENINGTESRAPTNLPLSPSEIMALISLRIFLYPDALYLVLYYPGEGDEAVGVGEGFLLWRRGGR